MGDLTAEEQQALDLHLRACPSCQGERDQYEETLRLLQSTDDEPVPRHFFVYPEERKVNPWQLFRQLMPRWQAAAVCVAALVVLIGAVSIIGVQVRADQGGWTVSVGRPGSAPAADTAALKAEILRTTDERNQEVIREWVRALRVEMSRSRTELTEQQQDLLAASLTSLESRLNNRMALTADEIKTGSQKAIGDMYQAVSLQQDENVNAINARLDKAAASNELKFNQTDAILETLLQVAELRIRQTGEQK
jgi:hypothetical protein